MVGEVTSRNNQAYSLKPLILQDVNSDTVCGFVSSVIMLLLKTLTFSS